MRDCSAVTRIRTAACNQPVKSSRNSDAGLTPVTNRWSRARVHATSRHIEQVPLAVVDFFQVGIVRDILDAIFRRNDLVVARDDGDGPKIPDAVAVYPLSTDAS